VLKEENSLYFLKLLGKIKANYEKIGKTQNWFSRKLIFFIIQKEIPTYNFI